MVVSELTPEQIIAIGTAVAAIVGGVIAAARQAAKRGGGGEPPAPAGASYLLLDAGQVKALTDAMGILAATLVENRRALERNSEVCERMLHLIDQTQDELRGLTLEIARNPRGR